MSKISFCYLLKHSSFVNWDSRNSQWKLGVRISVKTQTDTKPFEGANISSIISLGQYNTTGRWIVSSRKPWWQWTGRGHKRAERSRGRAEAAYWAREAATLLWRRRRRSIDRGRRICIYSTPRVFLTSNGAEWAAAGRKPLLRDLVLS